MTREIIGFGCGACHQNGGNPDMKNGKCEYCNRNEEMIIKCHGGCHLTDSELTKIQNDIRPQGDK